MYYFVIFVLIVINMTVLTINLIVICDSKYLQWVTDASSNVDR